MQLKIDWFSFTLKREVFNDDTEPTVLRQVMNQLQERYESFFDIAGDPSRWAWQPGKKPYRASVRNPDGGISIWLHPALDHVMIELTGRGCDTLGEWHDPFGFIAAFADRSDMPPTCA